MPKVTNAFDTYTAQANREDLSDAIYNIDPMDTPFVTAISTRDVSNVVFDWQTEKLPGVDADNAQLEGFELARTPGQATVRQNNMAQISKRDATVTGSQEAGNPAGKRSEMGHQMALAGKALKRDMEKILIGTQGRVDGDATTARKTRALESWLATNALREATGSDAADATASPTDGATRAFSEDLLKTAMQTCYANGAEPSIVMVGPINKGVISGFVGREQARSTVGETKVQASVSLYASDFGDLKVMPNRWQRERSVLLIDPQYARVAYYRRPRPVTLSTIGDATTEMIVAEYGLQVDNEAAHGIIADVNDS